MVIIVLEEIKISAKMTETDIAIRLKIEEGDTIKEGDLVTVKNTDNFIKDLIYKVFKVSESTIIIKNKSGSETHFKIGDPRVDKVQDAF